MTRLTLIPHPRTAQSPFRAITVDASLDPSGNAAFSFAVTGEIENLQVPSPASCERADDLWRRTCFEVFIAPSQADDYVELNFSPSTEWAAYWFDGYRRGMEKAVDCSSPRIESRTSQARFQLRAQISLDWIKWATPWRIGLSAILLDARGEYSYWALAHPADKPDFHDRAGFIYALEKKARS